MYIGSFLLVIRSYSTKLGSWIASPKGMKFSWYEGCCFFLQTISLHPDSGCLFNWTECLHLMHLGCWTPSIFLFSFLPLSEGAPLWSCWGSVVSRTKHVGIWERGTLWVGKAPGEPPGASQWTGNLLLLVPGSTLPSVSAAIFLPQSPNCLLSLRGSSLPLPFLASNRPTVLRLSNTALLVWTLPLNRVQVSLSSKETLGLCNWRMNRCSCCKHTRIFCDS